MRIDEKQYGKMPPELRKLFVMLPNPCSDEVLRGFPESQARTGQIGLGGNGNSVFGTDGKVTTRYDDIETSAARFFYCAKASRSERNAGLEGMPEREREMMAQMGQGKTPQQTPHRNEPQTNHHPTVKPLALMEYLVRLTKTPTGGVVLDPFMGSGTMGIACVNEGREFIGIEMSDEYLEIARRRIEYAEKERQPRLL